MRLHAGRAQASVGWPTLALRLRGLLHTALAVTWLALAPNRIVSADSSGAFKVGIAASLTGAYSEWSEAVQGYKLWEAAINNAGGIALRSVNGTTRYRVNLVVLDDRSTAAGHAEAVNTLLTSQAVDIVLGASPVFAEAESIAVSAAGKLNFLCCASSSAIYARDQRSVFGMPVDSTLFTSELFTEFRAQNVFKLAVLYRDNVAELQTVCTGVAAQARAQLLNVALEIRYSNSSAATLAALADSLAASPAEAIIMCGLAAESAAMARLIDERRKPLKAIVFSQGAYTRDWNDQLGNLSVSALSFAHWAPDLPRKDDFWGSSTAYSGVYKSTYGTEPTYIAAAASATGYVLQSVLQNIFRNCILSPATVANASALLFEEGAIDCADNINYGQDRLITALAQVNMDTFYGAVSFNRFRQNQGYSPVTLQTYEVTENLKEAFKPSVVLPLVSAARPLLLPQRNRYAPVCQPGTYHGKDEFEPCIPCNAGEFQEFPARTSCELCPKDHFANGTAMPICLTCPANTLTVLRGSTNLTDCLCKPGFFNRLAAPGLPCEPCPANAYCAGGMVLPSPLNGFYAEEDEPFVSYPCNPARFCKGNFTCAAGYRGRMCSYCAPGFYRFLGKCEPCPSHPSTVIGYLLVLALLWVIINIALARTMEVVMVVIGFCQLLSIVVNFSLNWPDYLYQVMSLAAVFSFEMDALEPSCLVRDWGFAQNMIVQLMLPVIMALLVAAWCAVTYIAFRLKQAGLSRSVKAAASLKLAQEAPWKQVMWALLSIPMDKREMSDTLLERAAIPLNFLNIGYLVLLKYNLTAMTCTSVNGVKYMAASPNDRCYTRKHWNLILLGTAGLIVYNLGFLSLYGHVLRQLRKARALGDKRPLLLYGWMYERYEAQYYWYEIASIAQRTAFVLVQVFVSDPALQAVLALLATAAVMLLDTRTNAYVDRQIHMLQGMSDGVLAALLVAGLLFYNPLAGRGITTVAEFVLLAAVIAALAVAAASVVQTAVLRVMVLWLMSKHRPIAYNMGQRVTAYRFMYQVFGPFFLFNWLRRCDEDEWREWHQLCMMLNDFVHPTSEVSYLSLKKVGRFWRYLLSNFPETIDYLVSVQKEQRDDFNSFIEALYEDFFDTKAVHRQQLYYYVTDKYKAAIGQWLSSCEEEDRVYLQKVLTNAFGKAKGAQAANDISTAMSRSCSRVGTAVVVLAAANQFKSRLAGSNPGASPLGVLKSARSVQGLSASGATSDGEHDPVRTAQSAPAGKLSMADSAGEVPLPSCAPSEAARQQADSCGASPAATPRQPRLLPTEAAPFDELVVAMPTPLPAPSAFSAAAGAATRPPTATKLAVCLSPRLPPPELSRVSEDAGFEEVLTLGEEPPDLAVDIRPVPERMGGSQRGLLNLHTGAQASLPTATLVSPRVATARLHSLRPTGEAVAVELGDPDLEEEDLGPSDEANAIADSEESLRERDVGAGASDLERGAGEGSGALARGAGRGDSAESGALDVAGTGDEVSALLATEASSLGDELGAPGHHGPSPVTLGVPGGSGRFSGMGSAAVRLPSTPTRARAASP